MAVPVSQMATVASYVLKQKLSRKKRYPLVLMLEPLLRCNLSCSGCGKIQYPGHILKREMSVEDALAAVDECDTPIVSIPGGEPLLHSKIDQIVDGIVQKKKYLYLCTNAQILKKKLEQGLFTPSKYLTFSVHLDGVEGVHDQSVCREGAYKKAVEAMRLALDLGFRVTTNTTLYNHVDIPKMRDFFDQMMAMGIESMMISPGYSYSKAPNQNHFLNQEKTFHLFRALFFRAKKSWRFNHSPLFLEFLMGKRDFVCFPWANPCYTFFGWQKPCYLIQEGYAHSFEELLNGTDWQKYGKDSGNPHCQQCMVHCGYEPTAVDATFGSLAGFLDTVKATLLGVDSQRGRNLSTFTSPQLFQNEPEQDWMKQKVVHAIDFRGDVEIELKDQTKQRGYLFNLKEDRVDFFPQDSETIKSIQIKEIQNIETISRDWADGHTWQSWLKKQQQKEDVAALSVEV